MKKDNLAKALADIVAKIPKSKRLEVQSQITQIQKEFGSVEDLFEDGRSKMWRKGGSARAKVDARPDKPEPLVYEVSWREGGSGEYTAADAAKIAKRSVIGLGISVAKLGALHLTVEDGGWTDIVTIKRLQPRGE